jgi:hypothetical protein
MGENSGWCGANQLAVRLHPNFCESTAVKDHACEAALTVDVVHYAVVAVRNEIIREDSRATYKLR